MSAEIERAWPCDDYKPPLTCWTTPKPRALICEGCRAAFPDGPEVRRLYGIPPLPFKRGEHEVVIDDVTYPPGSQVEPG